MVGSGHIEGKGDGFSLNGRIFLSRPLTENEYCIGLI